MSGSERTIVVLLRVMGSFALCAIPAVFLPHRWMDAIHGFLGMGQLPDEPIVSYLARSLSTFYAIYGAILVFASTDLVRYRALIVLLAWLSIILGFVLLGIDMVSGMPLYWTLLEGPFTISVGTAIVWLQRQTRGVLPSGSSG
jgi:hypothetical protein